MSLLKGLSRALWDVIMFVSKSYPNLFQSVVSAGWPRRRLSMGSGLRGRFFSAFVKIY